MGATCYYTGEQQYLMQQGLWPALQRGLQAHLERSPWVGEGGEADGDVAVHGRAVLGVQRAQHTGDHSAKVAPCTRCLHQAAAKILEVQCSRQR